MTDVTQTSSAQLRPGGHWRNWVGNQSFIARHKAEPGSEDELAALVREASRQNLSIRVAGSGHSFTPIVATSGLLLSLKNMQGLVSADLDRKRVVVRAGTRIGDGLVTATVARLGSQGKMADDDLICSPPVSACDHPARRLALCAFHAQLSRRRRSARGARSGCLLRDGAAMGFEVRAVVRPRTSPSTPAANFAMASRRDGRDDCGPAVLALARGRR